jgi:Transcriptional activator of glycolytic enzymes
MKALMVDYLKENNKHMTMALASQFANIAVGLVHTQGDSLTPPMEAASPPEVQQPDLPRTTRTDLPPSTIEFVCPTIATRLQPYSVTAIWDEYHGRHFYQDHPVCGGLKALEEKHGTKWRQGDKSYQKAFSRMQQIVRCVGNKAERDGTTIDEVLTEFDILFDGMRVKSVSKLIDLLTQDGHMTKRARKSSPADSESLH